MRHQDQYDILHDITELRVDKWTAQRVRAFRRYLGYTQDEFSHYVGARQQTVSEWETGRHRPRGMSAATLSRLARDAGFDHVMDGRFDPRA